MPQSIITVFFQVGNLALGHYLSPLSDAAVSVLPACSGTRCLLVWVGPGWAEVRLTSCLKQALGEMVLGLLLGRESPGSIW